MEAISFTKTFTPILNSSRLINFRLCAQPVSNLHGRRNSSRSKLFASSAVSTAADKIFDDPLLEAAVMVDRRSTRNSTGLLTGIRLAPLSEGRIDQWGRLQCVYHGWCFNGAGECKLIPQAPLDGPSVHTSKRACASVYPSTVQNGILWVWPNSDPKYRDILSVQKPPYISDLDDPSFTKPLANRDFPFGYGLLITSEFKRRMQPGRNEVRNFGINGFDTTRFGGESKFIAPCVYYSSVIATALRELSRKKGDNSASAVPKVKDSSAQAPEKRVLLVFFCIPVGPGKSRLIFSFPRNFAVWADKLIPRWISHVGQNLVLDSDLYLLHLEERKIMEAGISNWSKACFMPTKADTQVIAFKRWLRRYSGGQINWGAKYWYHVVNCSSCNGAYKALKVVEVALQNVAVASIAIVAATAKQSTALRSSVVLGVTVAVLCYAAS
ncbi:Protochlorophyllide-dependent translocon component 52, chloroplastic, partial [Linum perenne]